MSHLSKRMVLQMDHSGGKLWPEPARRMESCGEASKEEAPAGTDKSAKAETRAKMQRELVSTKLCSP